MIELYKEGPLYLTIMQNDIPKIISLKIKGFTLSKHIVTVLTYPVGGAKMSEYKMAWYGHTGAVRKMNDRKLTKVLRRLTEELGPLMYYSSAYS